MNGQQLKADEILRIEDLHVSFLQASRKVYAVNGISFSVKRAETVGIVGESGCGKSVTASAVLGLIPRPPGLIEQGSVWVAHANGVVDTTKHAIGSAAMRRIRGKEVSLIFQEPMRSLHPMYNIGWQLIEGIQQHFDLSQREALDRGVDLLRQVDLPKPEEMLHRFPHQLSGGMRQRVMIAIALSCNPKLLIADEPTTALDVTIQAQILDLLRSLQRETGVAIMLITHDLGVIAETVKRVVVMYLGQIVEESPVETLFSNPSHPYTKGLIGSIPSPDVESKTDLRSMGGTVTELSRKPLGCVFSPRCPHVMEVCRNAQPPFVQVGTNHGAKCWLFASPGDSDGEGESANE